MRHVPVLLTEVVESLQLKPGMNVVDCTLGDAGHSEVILEHIAPQGKLLGIDADPEAILRAKQFLYRFENRVEFARDNFAHITKIVTEKRFSPVNAVLMDLGWSSPQFAQRGRGFSFEKDEPLDMRFSGSADAYVTSAEEIVNTYSKEELHKLFRLYGEEKLSTEIAVAIVNQRKKEQGVKHKIETTKQLVDIILDVYRKKLHSTKDVPWIGGLHPATKVFQAIRMEANRELEVLRQALPQALDVLKTGGRLAVITFHSGEDRIVKQYFKSVEGKSITIVTKKPIVPSEAECELNTRAQSAKLRVVEKI